MIGNKWDEVLEEEFKKDYFKKIIENTNIAYQEKNMYPSKDKIFYALKLTDYKDVKVVILGQDPYHGKDQANGLAFAVNDTVKLPPSLKNIYKELKDDLNIEIASSGNLECWAKEGVLLLNAILTVEKDKPASCKKFGWEEFTDIIIKKINEKEEPIVFILWGNFARSKKKYITNPIHLVIESTHPSPYSARNGFFGSKPFSKTNKFLDDNNIKKINWQVR